MKFLYLIIINFIIISAVYSQDTLTKVPLDHSVYENWKKIEKSKISEDGKYVTYEINPAKGDGFFYIFNSITGKLDSLSRGYDGSIIPNTNISVLKIKPPFNLIRKLKLDKKKPDEMPKDTLCLVSISLQNKIISKIPDIGKYLYTETGSPNLIFLRDYKSDTIKQNTKKKNKLPKHIKDVYQLNILNLQNSELDTLDDVADFELSKKNNYIIYHTQITDSLKTGSSKIPYSEVYVYNLKNKISKKIFESPGKVSRIAISSDGSNSGFLHTMDTSSVKRFSLYYYNQKEKIASKIADSNSYSLPDNWEISENGNLIFSEDNSKLFFNTAPKIFPSPKDTLLEDEKYKVDIWNWNDPLLQSQQLKELDKTLKKAYTSIFRTSDKKLYQVSDTLLNDVKLTNDAKSDLLLGLTNVPYQKYLSWEEPEFNDAYLIDLKAGERKLILSQKQYSISLSPFNKYVLYYETSDSSWNTYSISEDKSYKISKDIPNKIDNEEWDMPMSPQPYGIAGWTKDDEYILIYDRYDIWKVKPDNSSMPVCLTNGYGRNNKIVFRYIDLYPDSNYIGFDGNILAKGINQIDFSEGFYNINLNEQKEPILLVKYDNAISTPIKSKASAQIIFSKSSYREYPDLWYTNLDFLNPIKISLTNPQQNKYLWGNVEIFNWKDSSGTDMRGLLYKPENFDSSKKYPTIVYFYEKYTQDFNSHYSVLPSRSVINFPMYNSNGYIVFIPDISYKVGYPGESAYNTIMSGTKALIEQGYIDENNIGLQGQSWGGYQTAYMVSRTGFFKAAMAGAPVVNMTSAYGGIRWESGMTRIFQYEKSQSRIGGTLWDRLDLYLSNSALFNADKITTPLLIMANDNDGAVPYQQGLEMFNSMRRLGKTVYLLNYNGDEHNLMKWPNRVDLSIRMLEFFDHYLKNKPMPLWMEKGIPAIKKGVISGY